MTKKSITTWYLEMTEQESQAGNSCEIPDFNIIESRSRHFELNRFLYSYVGKPWGWVDKLGWSDDRWQEYIENDNLRLWIGYYKGTPAGYFELVKRDREVEIAYFGLAQPFIGKGLGSGFLTYAINQAWSWNANRVVVNTCTLDHSGALPNYLARGFKIYKEESV